MVAAFRADLGKSSKAFADLVWPAIRSICGGGQVRYVEGSAHETDRVLDMLAGIDAYQILDGVGIRGIASRVQAVGASYDTFTIRYERRSSAGFDTEYKKRLTAIRSQGEIISAYLFVQAYVSNDWSSLLSVAAVRVRDLLEYAEKEREAHGGSFPIGRRNGVYLDEVRRDGAATFVVVPWSRLAFGAVDVKIIRKGKNTFSNPDDAAHAAGRIAMAAGIPTAYPPASADLKVLTMSMQFTAARSSHDAYAAASLADQYGFDSLSSVVAADREHNPGSSELLQIVNAGYPRDRFESFLKALAASKASA